MYSENGEIKTKHLFSLSLLYNDLNNGMSMMFPWWLLCWECNATVDRHSTGSIRKFSYLAHVLSEILVQLARTINSDSQILRARQYTKWPYFSVINPVIATNNTGDTIKHLKTLLLTIVRNSEREISQLWRIWFHQWDFKRFHFKPRHEDGSVDLLLSIYRALWNCSHLPFTGFSFPLISYRLFRVRRCRTNHVNCATIAKWAQRCRHAGLFAQTFAYRFDGATLRRRHQCSFGFLGNAIQFFTQLFRQHSPV